MANKMFTALLLVCAVHLCTGLQCYQCANYITGNQEVDKLLSDAGLGENEACQNFDASKLESAKCDAGSSGGCMKTTAEATVSYQGKDYMMKLTLRGCLPGVSGSDECQSSSDDTMLQAFTSTQGVTVSNFKATGCVCSDDSCNGQTRALPTLSVCFMSVIWTLFSWW